MNILKKAYCRTYQFIFKILLPFLPYKDPIILDKIRDIIGILKDNNKKHPCIITDPNIHKLGLINSLEAELKNNNINYVIFDKVVANPTTDNVEDAVAIYQNNNCDCLIAFGGGSPMDCAKGVGARLARPKKRLSKLRGVLKVRKKIPLLIAIPTTAGSGSETTIAAVLVDSQTRFKYAINDFPLIPKYAVLDEEVTKSLPSNIVSSTGMDALTHAIEAYIGRSGNKETNSNALEAIKLVFNNLEKAYYEPTADVRKNMLLASHLAGKAFTKAYVGYVHALSHALSGKYNVPHGLANAVILPIVLKEYGKAIYKKLYQIAIYCDLVDNDCPYNKAAEIVINKIEKLNEIFNHPKVLEVRSEDLYELSHHADKEANPLYPVPVLWNRKELEKMYKKIGNLK